MSSFPSWLYFMVKTGVIKKKKKVEKDMGGIVSEGKQHEIRVEFTCDRVVCMTWGSPLSSLKGVRTAVFCCEWKIQPPVQRDHLFIWQISSLFLNTFNSGAVRACGDTLQQLRHIDSDVKSTSSHRKTTMRFARHPTRHLLSLSDILPWTTTWYQEKACPSPPPRWLFLNSTLTLNSNLSSFRQRIS